MSRAPTADLVLAFESHRYNGGERHRPHAHDALHFSLVLRGRVAETVHRRTDIGTPLSVVAKDAGVVHADDFCPTGARLARLSLPGGSIAQLLDDPSRGMAWHWSHSPAVAAPFLRLVRRAGAAAGPTFATCDADVVDLLAAFTARPCAAPARRPPRWLVDSVGRVRDAWDPSLTVAILARDAGVHPVYLARCVRRWYGSSVSAELRRARLRAAAAAIAGRRDTLSTVAHAMGYADEPHLNRDFRAVVGLTPGQFRRLAAPSATH